MMQTEDTIAAISTPPGTGGIAVVRVSGPEAIALVDRLWHHAKSLRETPSHTARVGLFLEKPGGEPIDQVVVTVFRKPNSYTGEDVVEISCHGGRYLAQMILEAVLAQGARLAEPGEFTRRAFLHGRIDLAQAEAVADLIQAKTKQSVKYAMRQLRGGFSRQIQDIQQALVALLANLELELDFAEEDIVLTPAETVLGEITQIKEEILRLVKTYRTGRMIHEGVRVIIVGKPNVGKSSLFNALLGFERAIVDETPGTTRDAIEAHLDIGGTFFRLIDTAGLRDTRERIERKGIDITEAHLREADLILFLLDASVGFTAEDRMILEKIETVTACESLEQSTDVILLWNKIDLVDRLPEAPVAERGWPLLAISAKKGQGLEDLHEHLARFVEATRADGQEGEVVTNLRHQRALVRAAEALERAREAQAKGMSSEFVALDVREALNAVGEIIGKTTPDDILNYIFDHFCIGK